MKQNVISIYLQQQEIILGGQKASGGAERSVVRILHQLFLHFRTSRFTKCFATLALLGGDGDQFGSALNWENVPPCLLLPPLPGYKCVTRLELQR